MTKKKTKPRRGHGEGSYSYYPKMNRWRAFFPDPNKNGKRITACFMTEQEADDWLTLKQAEVITNEYIPHSDETLGEYSLHYLNTYSKNGVRARTYEGYISLIAHIAPIADIRSQDLTVDHFIRLYDSIDRSGSTKKKLHRLLKQILKQATIAGRIRKNPMDDIPKAIIPKETPAEIDPFSPEELQQIFKAAKDDHYELLFLLFSVTGMRLSEGLGLRRQDFDSTLNRIHIRQTLHRSREKGIIYEEPKSSRSKRAITIPAALAKKIAKSKHKHPTMLFSNSIGGVLTPEIAKKHWIAILKKANVRYRGLHTLRHTHATLLLKNGTPITEVSRRLGHAKVSTTLDVYSHALPADDLSIVGMVSSIYNL